MKQQFILVLLLLFVAASVTWSASIRSPSLLQWLANPRIRCIDPDDQYLEFLYSEYLSRYRIYEEQLIMNNTFATSTKNNSQQTSSSGSNANAAFMSNEHCDDEVRNRTKLSGKSVCPWIYVISLRWNIYPR